MHYKVNVEDLTVTYTDQYGETHDLNEEGAEINDYNDLVEFIRELHKQNVFGYPIVFSGILS